MRAEQGLQSTRATRVKESMKMSRFGAVLDARRPALAVALGFGVIATSASSAEGFVDGNGPGALAHQYPVSFKMIGGVLKNTTSANKELTIPLTSPLSVPVGGVTPYRWCANLAVGSDVGTLEGFSCTLFATNESGSGTCGATGTGVVHAAAGKIKMVTGASACSAAFIQCTVPPNMWVSNVRWNPFTPAPPLDAC